jgi:integrase/recombinase XerD
VNRESVERFLASHPYARNTKDRYIRVLGLVYGLPVSNWQAVDLICFLERPEWGNSQKRLALYALRKYIRWKWGDDHPALEAKLPLIKPKKQRVLTMEKALELLASFDTSIPAGARNLALCAVALDTGLRCSELCRLALPDVDLHQRTLQVIVKGGQWGVGIFSAQTALYIDRWLTFRALEVRQGIETLFVSLHHERRGLPLTREGLQGIVKRWGLSLGIKLSPHDLRRSFATLATVFGAPSRVVQEAGRWSSIDMVERYTRGLDASAIDPYLPVARLVK